MSQKKMTFSQKFQKAKSSGSFFSSTYAGTGSIFFFACVLSIRLSGFSAM